MRNPGGRTAAAPLHDPRAAILVGAGGKGGEFFKALPSPYQQHLSLSWISLLSAALCSAVGFGQIASELGSGALRILRKGNAEPSATGVLLLFHPGCLALSPPKAWLTTAGWAARGTASESWMVWAGGACLRRGPGLENHSWSWKQICTRRVSASSRRARFLLRSNGCFPAGHQRGVEQGQKQK